MNLFDVVIYYLLIATVQTEAVQCLLRGTEIRRIGRRDREGRKRGEGRKLAGSTEAISSLVEV
jgi:hypothetical protein